MFNTFKYDDRGCTLIESIHENFVIGRCKFTARGYNGFRVQIDYDNANDRKYVLEVIETTLKQMRAKIYYGRLYRNQVEDLKNYLLDNYKK
jgi:hypothetical protein